MASAKPGIHLLKLKSVTVPEALTRGNKFIKWDDDSTMGVPVTLKVDPKGYILYWKDQHKDMDYLDISLIRDTRTGKFARTPKEGKLRDTVDMGAKDVALEDKTVTVVYGTDLCNVVFLNFASNSKDVAKEWTDALFVFATNLLRQNACPLSYIGKCYSKLSLVLGPDGKIPIRHIYKMFASHKDDKKRVEKALEGASLPTNRNDSISPSKFQLEDFMRFYRHLCARPEVERIFRQLSRPSKLPCGIPLETGADVDCAPFTETRGAKKKVYLTAEQFVVFLNTEQRDPRLNEILYPFYDVKRARAIIDAFEPNKHLANKDEATPEGYLSAEGFLIYLMSDDNVLLSPEKLDLSEDMEQPLSHYFINSSHNTYLTGHQLTGQSSVEIYRQCLLTGCRCVELDCWDGKGADEEPTITHGYTMCTVIGFKDAIEAIAESAFKVSEYPLILSFENHCSPKQQAKMAAHCRNILGDLMLSEPLESYPLEPGSGLPPPELLKRRIIIKNKKIRHVHKTKTWGEDASVAGEMSDGPDSPTHEPTSLDQEDVTSSESDMDSDDEGEKEEGEKEEKGTAGREAQAGTEMSELVNYIQPVHFHSFDMAEKRNRSYEVTSFVETQATALLKEHPVDFVNFNKRQISRIYPKGTRVDSSNYMPQIFWNAGCQLVALNFQTLDLAMMLNLGIFEYNGRSGFILKPDFMRRADRHFDPFAESTVDGIVANTVEIQIISGQLLSDRRVGTYVEVDMYGLPADTVRKKFRTKTIANNVINPLYDEEPFVFKKVVLPKLATLRIAVSDENGRLIGHRVLPVEGLRPGYRHIGLRNELNQPVGNATIFVHISLRDYVPDAFADFAAALADPISYQSALEKHSQQLAMLEEDFDAPTEEDAEQMVTAQLSLGEESLTSDGVMARGASVRSTCSVVNGSPLSRGGSQRAPHTDMVRTDSMKTDCSAGGGACAGRAPTTPTTETIHGLSTISFIKLNAVKRRAMKNLMERKLEAMFRSTLADPSVTDPATLESLYNMKAYQKLAQRQEKEVEALRKKHEKARAQLAETHEVQEEKLLLSQIKIRTSLDKTQRKSVKRTSRRTAKPDEASDDRPDLAALLAEQETRHRALKHQQCEAMVAMLREQMEVERDLQLRSLPQLHQLLEGLVTVHRDTQLRRLDELHEREVQELKKKLDALSRDEMKGLAKRHKDKNELLRVKREAQQKHISLAVQERQKLSDILERRKTEVEETHAALASNVTQVNGQKLSECSRTYAARLLTLVGGARVAGTSEGALSVEAAPAVLSSRSATLHKGGDSSDSSFVSQQRSSRASSGHGGAVTGDSDTTLNERHDAITWGLYDVTDADDDTAHDVSQDGDGVERELENGGQDSETSHGGPDSGASHGGPDSGASQGGPDSEASHCDRLDEKTAILTPSDGIATQNGEKHAQLMTKM